MKTSALNLLTFPMLATASFMLAGCGPGGPTVITYEQVGTCKSYPTPTGAVSAKPNEGFAIFKIASVDNSKHNENFYLDVERFYVNQSNPTQLAGSVYTWNRRFLNPDPRFARNLGYPPVETTTIPANEKREYNSYVVVPLGINNPTEGPAEKQYEYKFDYDTGSNERGNIQSVSEGITFVKTNPEGSKYTLTENCKDLIK